MKKKKQIVIILGGEIFSSYKKYLSFLKNYKMSKDKLNKKRWRNQLKEELKKRYEFSITEMPNSKNARYVEWKIWFKKMIPFINDNVILIGSSLGGLFLIKYLSENKFPKKIKALFLVAPPFDNKDRKCFLADFVFESKNLNKIKKQCLQINFYHSKDDPVVPFEDFNKYKKYLPEANFFEFKDRGHFTQKTFPEILKHIKKLS